LHFCVFIFVLYVIRLFYRAKLHSFKKKSKEKSIKCLEKDIKKRKIFHFPPFVFK